MELNPALDVRDQTADLEASMFSKQPQCRYKSSFEWHLPTDLV